MSDTKVAASILQTAKEIVSGSRNEQHGGIAENFTNIAALWGAYLGVKITPADVASLMELLKIARRRSGSHNPDDYVDAAGYAAIGGQLSEAPTPKVNPLPASIFRDEMRKAGM